MWKEGTRSLGRRTVLRDDVVSLAHSEARTVLNIERMSVAVSLDLAQELEQRLWKEGQRSSSYVTGTHTRGDARLCAAMLDTVPQRKKIVVDKSVSRMTAVMAMQVWWAMIWPFAWPVAKRLRVHAAISHGVAAVVGLGRK